MDEHGADPAWLGSGSLRWFRSARRLRVGKRSALYVMRTEEPEVIASEQAGRCTRLEWIGRDERGRELEIVAIELTHGGIAVIHVMPTVARRRSR